MSFVTAKHAASSPSANLIPDFASLHRPHSFAGQKARLLHPGGELTFVELVVLVELAHVLFAIARISLNRGRSAALESLLSCRMTIRQAVDAKVHFFASHSWTHRHRREGLHAILRPWARGLDFQDYSISRAHPLNTDTDPELARELRDIIVGMYANNSPWMQFEIDMAFAFNVPIISILANGQERVPRLPTRLATFQPVRWRGDSIRETLLRCLSLDRRQAIEAQVAYRVAAAEEVERQRRVAEAARRAQAHTRPVFLPPAQSLPMLPLRRKGLADYLDPQPTLPTNYLSDLLRRR